jgi:DNA-binding IclR family transcriptional regulator
MNQRDDNAVLARAAGDEAAAVPAVRAPEDRHFVAALARGLQVLACFRSGDRTLGNLEIARRCGLPKSTVSRLTSTLKRLGYLIQVEDSGKYRLGMATLSLGGAMLARLDIRHLARPGMQELADFSRADVALGTRDRRAMLYIESCRSSAALTLSVDVGSRIPLATSAMGRAWLAMAPEAERREALAHLAERDPAGWPEIRAGIDKSLDEFHSLGVTCSFGDWVKDVNGIARAFQPGGGLPVMSINVGGPSSSLSPSFLLEEVRPRLLALVERLAPQAG